jgi:hypothetical protein
LQNPTHSTRSYIENSKFWNNETGITVPYTENTTLRNVTIISAAQPQLNTGIIGNIASKNNAFENLKVWGYFVGIEPARKGSTIINGGSWNNTHDVLIYTAAVEDRTVVITGVPASTKVTTVLLTANWGGPPATTFFVKDTIILNYGQFQNQQLFFNEQHANYIPFPTARPDMPSQYIGLTNQQLWNQFGIALGGGVAPSNAVNVSGIIGLVAPRLV